MQTEYKIHFKQVFKITSDYRLVPIIYNIIVLEKEIFHFLSPIWSDSFPNIKHKACVWKKFLLLLHFPLQSYKKLFSQTKYAILNFKVPKALSINS